MRYVALEEAFSIPELDGHQPPPWPENRFSQRALADWARRLPDFTEFRLPEMDAARIDVSAVPRRSQPAGRPGCAGSADACPAGQ
jgi:2,3-dihydroxybenzoate decarboxylase